MSGYELKIVSTATSPVKTVKDSAPLKYKPAALPGSEWELGVINKSMRKISGSVNSRSIDNEAHYNGYNNLVKLIDTSKTKVNNKNGFLGLGVTKRTITYYDKKGNILFTQLIDEDKKENRISFKGINGCNTVLYDNNYNGNFETMTQESLKGGRTYTWGDKHDNKKGNYDFVILHQNITGGRWYQRCYDFEKGKTVWDKFPVSSDISEHNPIQRRNF